MRFVYILVLAVVVVSGCSGSGVKGIMDGVKVNRFGFDSSTITGREQVELSLDVENVGTFDSSQVNFYLYGFDDEVWESVDSDATMGDAADDSWSVSDFKGYDLDMKSQGYRAEYFNTLRISEDTMIAKGITQSYSYAGRLCYDYETRANARIMAISASQRRDERGWGLSSGGNVEVFNTFGPLKVEVKTKSPVVFYESGGTQEAEIVLIITNVAGGYPAVGGCDSRVDVANINKLEGLEVTLDGDAVDCGENIYSFYDGQAVVYCTYSVTGAGPKGEYLLNVNARYYYYQDLRASINVVGSSDTIEVSEGRGAGIDRAAEVFKGIYCEDICEENAVQGGESEPLVGEGICVDGGASVATYPSTDIRVLLNNADTNGLVGSNQKVYLRNLKLHDVTVSDIGLRSFSALYIDGADVSAQYPPSKFFADRDGDGLPNDWEDLFGDISSRNKNTDGITAGDRIDDGSEICVECSGSGCDSGNTYKWNYNNGCKWDQYLAGLKLDLRGSLSDAWVKTNANPELHKIRDDEPVAGMKIYQIGDRTIAEMTEDHEASGVRGITYLDVEQLDLAKINVNFRDLFVKTKCKIASTYDGDVVCKCVVEMERGSEPYPPLESMNSRPCNDACYNFGVINPDDEIKGGRCVDSSQKGEYRCLGSRVVYYMWTISSVQCDDGVCLCYAEDADVDPTGRC